MTRTSQLMIYKRVITVLVVIWVFLCVMLQQCVHFLHATHAYTHMNIKLTIWNITKTYRKS